MSCFFCATENFELVICSVGISIVSLMLLKTFIWKGLYYKLSYRGPALQLRTIVWKLSITLAPMSYCETNIVFLWYSSTMIREKHPFYWKCACLIWKISTKLYDYFLLRICDCTCISMKLICTTCFIFFSHVSNFDLHYRPELLCI